MSQDDDTAARFLQRAEELRCVAEYMKNRQSRETLLRLADDYEKMSRMLLDTSKLREQPKRA
jgi:uncharacterized protein YjiS (DUF1127 family)